ncbi:MAG: D-alanyl-D-alanine carboxypeptidase [Clostridia bacterium]|nr:D-alanyl-D-alanine carboxypeptidase [Clostridia bacterium]
MKRIFLFCVMLVFSLNICSPVFAAVEPAPEIHGEAGVLMDLKTGRVLYSKNADKRMYPASTTKILTAIIALEKGNLSDVVTASSAAIAPITLQDSHMGILVGEQLTLEQLIYGMLVYSANDAANTIAVYLGGSIQGFADMMNQKAKEIGAVNSNFVNPHGFHDDNHYTTANDLAAIARYAMQNEKFRQIVSTPRYIIPPTNKYHEERILSSTNHLISKIRNSYHYYPYAIGIKTGYTSQAGNCLVAAAKQGDTEFLSVILKSDNQGTTDGAYSFVDTKKLFEYAFANYEYQTIATQGDIVSDSKVYEAKDNVRVALTPESNVSALLPKATDKSSEITSEITVNEKIRAPISKGDALGSVTYKYKDEVLGTTNLVAANDVKRDNILFVIHGTINTISNPLFIVCVILLAGLVIIMKIRTQKRRSLRRSKLGYSKYSGTFSSKR